MTFHDHFSGYAAAYARARPTYPAELFTWLARQAPGLDLAWDCGTGNGQAALGLAPHFTAVLGTDASPDQVAQAPQHERIAWRVAAESGSGLEAGTVDLVTAAQALHWFDIRSFFSETRRVLKPGGVAAVWCYGLQRVTPEIDRVVEHYYHDVVGRYWPSQRRLVESGYRDLDFPFQEFAPPRFAMLSRLMLSGVVDYIATWSAVQRYRRDAGSDPMIELQRELTTVWGDPATPRDVTWPIALRVGRRDLRAG